MKTVDNGTTSNSTARTWTVTSGNVELVDSNNATRPTEKVEEVGPMHPACCKVMLEILQVCKNLHETIRHIDDNQAATVREIQTLGKGIDTLAKSIEKIVKK